MVHPSGLEQLLTDAALQAPMFATRWRWTPPARWPSCAGRAGAACRVSPRMRAEDLLAPSFPPSSVARTNAVGPVEIPDHPLVNETLRDCLTEAMDAKGLKERLQALFKGEIRPWARETAGAIVSAHGS